MGIIFIETATLQQMLTAALNDIGEDRLLIEQPYEYKSVFLSEVHPDRTNPRFFPAIMMSDIHAFQAIERKLSKQQIIELYDAENKVLIGKGCIVNCFRRGSGEWKKANKSIESIIELAANLAVSEIIQVPTLFPMEEGGYQILTGHRRFFSLIFANGVGRAAHFKVYKNRPLLPKIKQFQENASREDLPQYGKLKAFESALLEVEMLNGVRKRKGSKVLTVREATSTLGISMGAYDNYNVLVRYPIVISSYEDGCVIPFVKMKGLILKVESEFKAELGIAILGVKDKKIINERISDILNGDAVDNHKLKKSSPYFKFKEIKLPRALKALLTMNVTELDSGICWDELDWENHEEVQNALGMLVGFLNGSKSEVV